MSRHVLVARLDSVGDMLISGPAIRAVAADADRVTVLAGRAGAAAAQLLPGVDEVIVWECPWIVPDPTPVSRPDVDGIATRLSGSRVDEALILTSFHQNALPTALLLRLAGVGRISAVSTDYPGALLDVRLAEPPDAPEPERMLAIAAGAGFRLPAGDDGRLAVLKSPPPQDLPVRPFLVLHPGVSAPARAYPVEHWAAVAGELTRAGWTVLVTGTPAEAGLTAAVAAAAEAPGTATDCAGRFDLAGLAAILSRAAVVVAANPGPAHLAAAVGVPVVSLFAPVVPALRWAPYGVPTVLLGDQAAACRDTRARTCPIPGHPCLAGVAPREVVTAVESLAHDRATVPA
jgi:ADP-heptose:LPS heptosyltransferase